MLKRGKNETRFMLERERDGVRMFRTLDYQDNIFLSEASEYLILGGNRSGKSICAASKFAAVARDIPVVLSDGREVDQRLSWQKNHALKMWAIGLNWDHVRTIYRLLFRPGLYRIIRDGESTLYRAFDPSRDKGREKETKASWPLIPFSEVKGGYNGIKWEDKKAEQFKLVELLNGNIIEAYASTGDVKMGDPVDYIWIDEEIAIHGHYAEWQARLSDRKGRIVWSTIPESNPVLANTHERAVRQKTEIVEKSRQKVTVDFTVLDFMDNPHIDDEEKDKRWEGFSEEDRRKRIRGEFVFDDLKIYPAFHRDIHRAIYANEELDDGVSKILRARNGQPPPDWTRELILDPGTKRPAVLFGAIPPQVTMFEGKEYELWGNGKEPYFICYDEIYLPRVTAREIAQHIRRKTEGYIFERFIIDGKAAAQTPMGFAGTIGQNYSDEFMKASLQCRATGPYFTYGDPSFANASKLVEAALLIRPCGTPRLRVVVDKCPELTRQIERNLKATEAGLEGKQTILNKEARGQLNDLRRCLEYWLSRRPMFVAPPIITPHKDPGFAMYQSLKARFEKKKPDEGVHIGPGMRVA